MAYTTQTYNSKSTPNPYTSLKHFRVTLESNHAEHRCSPAQIQIIYKGHVPKLEQYMRCSSQCYHGTNSNVLTMLAQSNNTLRIMLHMTPGCSPHASRLNLGSVASVSQEEFI